MLDVRKDHFERLHREEQRQAEWRMLDEALARRQATQSGLLYSLRHTLGGWLINLGTMLVGL